MLRSSLRAAALFLLGALLALLPAGTLGAQPCGAGWDHALGAPGANATVRAFAAYDVPTHLLFTGGDFTSIGGVAAGHIAFFDGVRWAEPGGGTNGPVHALLAFDDGLTGLSLYVGGDFTSAGGVEAHNLARWDGYSWYPVGDGTDGPVYALASHVDGGGPALYIGGAFRHAGSEEVNNVARWSGSLWISLGLFVKGTNGPVYSLASIKFSGAQLPRLTVGGAFSLAGGRNILNIAGFTGADWVTMGEGVNASVRSQVTWFEEDGQYTEYYIGGSFTQGTFTHTNLNGVGDWAGYDWRPTSSGMTGTPLDVTALAALDLGTGCGPIMYTGGSFVAAGGAPAANVAVWDDISWRPLGAGTGGQVLALGVFDDGSTGPMLFVGGSFATAGGQQAGNLARWGCLPAAAARSPVLGVNATSLSWSAMGDANSYDVVRGSLTALRSSRGDFSAATQACLASGTPASTIAAAADPPPGEGYWYLARGNACAVHGTWDSGAPSQIGSRDAEINGSAGACP